MFMFHGPSRPSVHGDTRPAYYREVSNDACRGREERGPSPAPSSRFGGLSRHCVASGYCIVQALMNRMSSPPPNKGGKEANQKAPDLSHMHEMGGRLRENLHQFSSAMHGQYFSRSSWSRPKLDAFFILPGLASLLLGTGPGRPQPSRQWRPFPPLHQIPILSEPWENDSPIDVTPTTAKCPLTSGMPP
jgi:hypothetical protein